MEILLVFLFLLAVITLVGHGIWVLIAAVFRALRGAQPSPPPERFFCDQCGTQLPAQHSPCAVCQQHTSATQMTREPENDLTATERQLRRFQAQGVLDAEKFDWLLRVVEYERHRLRGVPPTGIPEMPGQTMPETVTATEDPLPAPIDVPVTVHRPVPPMPATRPRKSVLEMLTSFMEERNIRWGEIIGGLLIVGCSLALVISFWSQIEQIPLLKFFIFTAMTGAFAGLGFYSEHRWKLPQTSRGLLITAMLLVPLNFLAIAAFSNEVSPNSSFVLITEVISFALFSLIVYRAGIVLTPRWAWALTLGIIGPSALQLLSHHTTDTTASMVTSSLFSALPILCAHLVSAVIWRRAQNEESRDPVFAYSALTLFSVSFFATIVAFCFAIFKTGNFLSSLSQFAPLVSLLAIPVLVIGAILRRRFAEISWLNLTAHSLGLLGSFVMGAALVLAWPLPETLIFVALINFAALTTLAFAYALPLGHLLALPCLLIAEVLSANLWFGKISQPSDSQSLLNAISSAFTGTALAFLFVPWPLAVRCCTGVSIAPKGALT